MKRRRRIPEKPIYWGSFAGLGRVDGALWWVRTYNGKPAGEPFIMEPFIIPHNHYPSSAPIEVDAGTAPEAPEEARTG